LHVITHNNSAVKFYKKNSFIKGKYLNKFYFIKNRYYDSFVFYKMFINNNNYIENINKKENKFYNKNDNESDTDNSLGIFI
jgi:hypothetical protein